MRATRRAITDGPPDRLLQRPLNKPRPRHITTHLIHTLEKLPIHPHTKLHFGHPQDAITRYP